MTLRMSVSTKARLIQQATNTPPYTPLPPWVTLAAFSAREAAWAGLPGDTSPQGSMKICPPICSAVVAPFCSTLPLRGAGMPLRRFR